MHAMMPMSDSDSDTITAEDRLRVFREDDEALAELAEITHKRAIADGGKDNAAGHLDLKIRERRAAMWGYDSPVRFDMVQVDQHKRPTSFEKIRAAIYGVIEQAPPAQRALRARLEELGPEKALALLGPPAEPEAKSACFFRS